MSISFCLQVTCLRAYFLLPGETFRHPVTTDSACFQSLSPSARLFDKGKPTIPWRVVSFFRSVPIRHHDVDPLTFSDKVFPFYKIYAHADFKSGLINEFLKKRAPDIVAVDVKELFDLTKHM